MSFETYWPQLRPRESREYHPKQYAGDSPPGTTPLPPVHAARLLRARYMVLFDPSPTLRTSPLHPNPGFSLLTFFQPQGSYHPAQRAVDVATKVVGPWTPRNLRLLSASDHKWRYLPQQHTQLALQT
jgi:hypothetical protein